MVWIPREVQLALKNSIKRETRVLFESETYIYMKPLQWSMELDIMNGKVLERFSRLWPNLIQGKFRYIRLHLLCSGTMWFTPSKATIPPTDVATINHPAIPTKPTQNKQRGWVLIRPQIILRALLLFELHSQNFD